MIVARLQKQLWSSGGSMDLQVDLDIAKNNFVTLYGPSGAGKTSILRMLVGLMRPDAGSISVLNTPWFDDEQKINLLPQKRQVGFLFQDYALFPNMTVMENLQYALSPEQDKSVIDELVDITDLKGLLSRKPTMLSGGQKQRVALARALVARPQILLLDEPFSAVDTTMRYKLQEYVIRVHQEFGLTTLMVSHDVGEVMKMSDQVISLNEGGITEQGSPSKVFARQQLSGKFQFTGEVIDIQQQGVIFIITVLIGKDLVKVVADESDIRELQTGDKVLVASKAFNPVIKKI